MRGEVECTGLGNSFNRRSGMWLGLFVFLPIFFPPNLPLFGSL